MRPFYETPQQRSQELSIAQFVGDVWGAEVKQMKSAFPADFMFRKDGSTTFAECKNRGKYSLAEIDRLGGLFVSLLKWGHIKSLCDLAKARFVVILRDGRGDTYWANCSDFEHDGVSFGGRTDRGDNQDSEPVVLLRANRFNKISLLGE